MCDIISKNCIVLDIDGNNKEDVIFHLCKELQINNRIKNNDYFYKKVMKREDMFPTSIGNYVAIPHGISSHDIKPSICFGRLKKPILWDEEKGEYVKIIILIAVPKNNEDNIHLHIISHLMRQLMHEDYIKRLLNSNKSQIYLALKEG